MKLSRGIFFFLLIVFSVNSFAQINVPKGYFQFPIKPGSRNFLAGNMGELRSTHFHGGIDIKTDGREGLPVYAAAEGYVSRVKVSSTGYGNALYITHPNGFTTVYAHLLNFSEPVADFVLQHQYQNESFDVELIPAMNQLTFKKGQVIGLSGNSGSSGGPHLHFEIRDSLENFYDPLLFGFTEIEDKMPPVVTKIAVKTFDLESRVNGEFGRFEFTPVLEGKDYVTKAPINGKGLIGIELLGYDRADFTNNKYGIANLQMTIDGEEVFSHSIEVMHFNDSRKILIHTDFEVAQKTSRRFEKLYIEDGNNLHIYNAKNKGKIFINDSATHEVTIRLWDVYKNERIVKFKIKGQPQPPFEVNTNKTSNAPLNYNLQENILQIICQESSPKTTSLAKVFVGHKSYELAPAYRSGKDFNFLWDVRSGLPDSIGLCNQTLKLDFSGSVFPGSDRFFSSQLADLRFLKTSLFDTLYLDIKKIEDAYKIHHPYVPLSDNIFITLKPSEEVKLKEKTAVYSVLSNNSFLYEGGLWNEKGEVSFKTKYLNYYVLLADTVGPTVKFANKTANEVQFVISDNLSGIKEFRATLNGKWLLMNYDHKRKLLWSSKLDKAMPLKGAFVLEVTDNACNKTVFNTTL